MEQNENTSKPKKRFNLFDWYYSRQRKKDAKADDFNALEKPSFTNFFKLLWRKLSKLLTANIIFVFGNFPLAFFLLAKSGIFDNYSYSPASLTWGPFQATLANAESTQDYVSSALIGIHGIHDSTQVYGITTIIFFILSLLTIFTWGFTKVGTTYLYRNMMSGEAVFPFSDFFYIIKRNVKQSLLFGAIDFIILALLLNNITTLFKTSGDDVFSLILMFLSCAILILYSIIRPYIFLMIFTFDLKFMKIVKNACAFAIIGIKRNLVALVGYAIIIILNVALIMLLPPIGIILPFIISVALFDFIGVYTAYPNIIKHMMNEEDARALIEGRSLIEEDDEDELEIDAEKTDTEVTE